MAGISTKQQSEINRSMSVFDSVNGINLGTKINCFLTCIDTLTTNFGMATTIINTTTPLKSFATAVTSADTQIDLGVGANTLTTIYGFDQYTSAGLVKTTGVTALAIDATTKTLIAITGTPNNGYLILRGI
jgi:hypothetical protein